MLHFFCEIDSDSVSTTLEFKKIAVKAGGIWGGFMEEVV